MKKVIKLLIGILGILIMQSCYKDIGPIEPISNDPTSDEPTESISFSENIQPIFDMSCISCHPATGNLDLTSAYSYDALVNVNASGYSGVLVIPEDTDNSILYKKIDGSGVYGGNMPLGSSLTIDQIVMIKQWIIEGAKNN